MLEQDEARAQRIGTLVNSIGEFNKLDGSADAQRAFLLGNTLINVFGPKVAAAVVAGFREHRRAESVARPLGQSAATDSRPTPSAAH